MRLLKELNQFESSPFAGRAGRGRCKIRIQADYPDPEGLLTTAYNFVRQLAAPDILVSTSPCTTSAFEEYFMETRPGYCRIEAADTEGI